MKITIYKTRIVQYSLCDDISNCIYDKYNKYGGETLTEITDKEVINKLNLLPIPENYAIISSKGIKYSYIDVSVQSKRYY